MIVLMLEFINGLDVQYAYVQNTYLNAKPKDKVLLYAGEYFGKGKGKVVIVIRILYGLKGARSAWAPSVFQLTRDLGLQPFWEDTDVWMRADFYTSVQRTTNTKANAKPGVECVLE